MCRPQDAHGDIQAKDKDCLIDSGRQTMKRLLVLGAVAALIAVTAISVFADHGSLAGRWHLNSVEDGSTADSSDHGGTGAVTGASVVKGRFGNALHFDGTTYVSIPDSDVLDISEGTWEAWLRFDALPSSAGIMNPLAKAFQYWIHGSSADEIRVKIEVGGIRYEATTATSFIVTDVWYHVAGTYDGETLKLYVDGVEVDTNEVPSGPIQTTTNILAIGTWSSLVDFFRGDVDEVRVWTCALPASEIARHARSNAASRASC